MDVIRRYGWTWGAPALAALALLNASRATPPLLSTAGTGVGANLYNVVLLAVPAAAVAIGLWTSGRWPWLLVAGAAAKLPEVAWSHLHFFSGRPGARSVLWAVGGAGTALIVIGVLSAASLLRAGRGAALAGGLVGAVLLGSTLLGLPWLDTPERSIGLDLGFAVLGLAGGALAVHGARTGRVPEAEQAPVGRRAAVIGTWAALLPALLAVADHLLLPVLPAPVFATTGAGVLVLLCAVGLAATLGSGLRASTAGLVLFAVAAPLTLAIYFTAGQMTDVWPSAVAGLVVGVLVGRTRFAVALAASACAVIGLTMATAGPVTGSYVEMASGEPLFLPAEVLVALCLAAVTATAATVAPDLARRRALPVVLGPLLFGLVLSLRALLQVFAQYEGSGTMLPEGSRTGLWAAWLGIATILLVTIAVLDRSARRQAASPGDPAEEPAQVAGESR